MTEPSNLRDAKRVADDCWAKAEFHNIEAAAAIIEADRAAVEAAVEAATIAKVVAWLRNDKDPYPDSYDIADEIEAEFGGDNGQRHED